MKRKIFLILFIALTAAILQADLAEAGFVMSDIDQMGLAPFEIQVTSSELLEGDQAISFQFHLNYDETLFTYNGYTAGADLPGMLVVNDLNPGMIYVAYAGSDVISGINELLVVDLEPVAPCETTITLTEARYNNTEITSISGGMISIVPFPVLGITIGDVVHQGLDTFDVAVQSNDISIDDEILSYQFCYHYDPAMMAYSDYAIDPELSGQLVVNAEEPGLINAAYAGADPISGINDLMIITFEGLDYGNDEQYISNAYMNNYEVTDLTNGTVTLYPAWDEMTVSVTGADIFLGDQFTSAVQTSLVMPENGLVAFQFILTYDAEYLEYAGLSDQNRYIDNLVINDTVPGVLQVAYANSDVFFGEGSLVEFLFNAITPTESTELTLTEVVYNNEYIQNLLPGEVIITNPNHAPVADAGEDFGVMEGDQGMLDGSGSYDPDDDAITYLWTGDLVLDDATAINPTFTAPEVEENTDIVMTLTVDDGQLSSSDEVIVTIVNVPNPADAVISMEDQDVVIDEEFAVNVYTTPLDAEYGVISYQYIVNYDPEVLTFNGYANGTGMPDGMLVVNDTEPGVLQIAFGTPDAITNPDYLTQLNFTGTILEQSEISISDFYYNNIAVTNITPSMITVHEPYYFTGVYVQDEQAGLENEFTCDIMTEELLAVWQIISYQFDLYYDPAMLEYTGYQLGDLPAGGNLLAYEMTPGHLSVAFADYNALSGAGSIAGFNFIPLQLGSTDVTIENFKYNATYLPNVSNGTIDIVIPYSSALISAPELVIGGGETFTVGISTTAIESDWNVISFQFDLGFDPALLDFVGYSNGSMINSGNLLAYENTDGNVSVAFADFAPISGEGTLVELEFTAAIDLDQSVLDIHNFKYNSLFLDEANINDGMVTIIEPYSDAVITCQDADTREGLNFTVGISTTELQDYWGVISFQFNVGFDPEYLEFVGYEPGSVITSGNLLAYENAEGNITVAFADYMSLSGEGDLIELEFTALLAGNTTLDVNQFKYNALYLDNLVDGSVFIDLGNYPPVADAGEDQTVYEGDEVTLNGSASYDPDDLMRTNRDYPDWPFNYTDYEYSFSMWSVVEINGIEVDVTNGMLGCFVGDECRGIAQESDNSIQYFPYFERVLLLPVIYSDQVSGETVTFKYYDPDTDRLYDIEESIDFVADVEIGSGFEPFVFTATYNPSSDLEFNWLAPEGITLDDPSSMTPSFVAPWVDETTDFTIGLEVSDGEAWSEVDEVVITVQDRPISGIVVSAPELQNNEDEDITVPISTTLLQPDMNLISYQFNLYYDPAVLQYNGFTPGALSDNMLVVNNVSPGAINIAYADLSPIVGEGELLTFQFTTLEGGVSPLDIENFKYNDIFITTVDGQVDVIPENDPPIFDLPPMISFNEDETLTVDFSQYIIDPDNDEHTILFNGNNMVEISVSGYNVTFSAPENWYGIENVVFIVNDNAGRAIAADATLINVISVNDIPIAMAGEDQIVDEGEMVYLNGSASYDPDGEDSRRTELTYNWIVPEQIVLDDAASPTPSFTAPWVTEDIDFVIGLEVFDGLDWSEVDELILTVIDHPITEVVVSVPELVIDENELFDVPITTTMIQPDMNVTSYEFNFTYDPALITYDGYMAGAMSNDLLVVNNLNPGLIHIAYADNDLITGEGELLSIQFEAIEGGISPLTISNLVYDETEITTESGQVEVINVNDPPVFDLPESFSFNEDESLGVDFSEYIIDPDNDSHTITPLNNSEIIVDVNGYMVTFSAAENWNGSEEITFSVNDNVNRDIVQDNVTIIVNPVNDPPVLDVPPLMYFDEDGEMVFDIGMYAYDVDNDDLVLYVTGMINLNVEIDGLVATITGTENWYGNEVLDFTVDDQHSRATATDQCDFVVEPVNDAPVIDLPEYISFNEDEMIDFDVALYASDVDEDILNIVSVEYDQSDLYNAVDDMMINFNAAENWFGITEVTITITDNADRDIASDVMTVEVLPVNDAPEFTDLPDSYSFNEDESLSVDLAPYISDVDEDTLILTATQGENVNVEVSGYQVNFSATENWFGEEPVIFTLNDQQGRATAIDTINIIVIPVNDPPVIDEYLPLEEELVYNDTTVTNFSIQLTDIEEDCVISWYINDQLIPGINTPLFPITFDHNGDFAIKVQVADADYMVENTWNITVWMGPDWEAVVYPSNTIVYSRVTIDGLPASELDMVGAYVDGELRGWVHPIYSLSDEVTYATLLVNGIEIEEIDFVLYDYSTNEYYNMYETYTSNPGGEIGTPPDFVNLAFGSGVGPNWTPVIYTNSTIVYGIVQIEGLPASEGDRVGVFVGPECRAVSDVVIDDLDIAYVTLIVQGETAQIAHFQVWDSSEDVILSVPITITTNPGGEIGYPPNEIIINATNSSNITQDIDLNTGWNLISVNVYPSSYMISDIFSDLIDNDELLKVKDIFYSYDPDLLPVYNTLTELNDGDGYYVRVAGNTTLSLEGLPVNVEETQISLNTGWNLKGYLPQVSQGVEDALFTIIDQLLKIKDSYGSYDPNLAPEFNTLSTMTPGSGYWIKMYSAATLIYPDGLRAAVQPSVPVCPVWEPVIYPNSTIAYGHASLEGLPAEGFIGAFAGDECRAASAIDNGIVSLVINGEDIEKIHFKLYKDGVIYSCSKIVNTDPGNDISGLEIYFDTKYVPIATGLANIYPNPFNPQTTISYDISEAGNVKLDIYNIKGQKVESLVNEQQNTGNYKVVWNANKQASGIYFLRFQATGHSETRKMILMK